MKKLIFIIILFFNLIPVLKKGEIRFSGPETALADSYGEDDEGDWSWLDDIDLGGDGEFEEGDPTDIIPTNNFDSFLDVLGQHGYEVGEPFQTTVTIDGVEYEGTITSIYQNDELVTGYFNPNSDNDLFDTNNQYAIGNTGPEDSGSYDELYSELSDIYGLEIIDSSYDENGDFYFVLDDGDRFYPNDVENDDGLPDNDEGGSSGGIFDDGNGGNDDNPLPDEDPVNPPDLPQKDCAGVVNGTAYLTPCGCVGGATGLTCPPQDPHKPCPGDPIKGPEIAATPAGKQGGRNGWTRKFKNGDIKYHDGLDIKAEPGSDLYSAFDGEVIAVNNSFSPGEYRADSYGNYIIVKTEFPNGEIITFKYNHLDEVGATQGQQIHAGQIIGKTGKTGNAASAGVPNKHVHIQARRINFGVSEKVNPEDYFTTKFDNQGNPINNPCGN